jgi:hypothetical protein
MQDENFESKQKKIPHSGFSDLVSVLGFRVCKITLIYLFQAEENIFELFLYHMSDAVATSRKVQALM